jgi:hypothetical protein
MSFNNISLKSLEEKERGYLFGLYMGDGYGHYDRKHRHYTIEFYLHSERNKEIQDFLIRILNKLGLKHFIMKDKRYKCNRVKVHSKILLKHLNSEYKDVTKNYTIGFISGLIDAEGYVNFKKSSISITNTDFQLLEICRIFLINLGLNGTIRERVMSKKDKKKSYILQIPVNFKALNTNSIKLNSG